MNSTPGYDLVLAYSWGSRRPSKFQPGDAREKSLYHFSSLLISSSKPALVVIMEVYPSNKMIEFLSLGTNLYFMQKRIY